MSSSYRGGNPIRKYGEDVMKKIILIFCITAASVTVFFLGIYLGSRRSPQDIITGITNPPKPTPLAKYTFDNLMSTQVSEGNFEIGKELTNEDKYTSYQFKFTFS